MHNLLFILTFSLSNILAIPSWGKANATLGDDFYDQAVQQLKKIESRIGKFDLEKHDENWLCFDLGILSEKVKRLTYFCEESFAEEINKQRLGHLKKKTAIVKGCSDFYRFHLKFMSFCSSNSEIFYSESIYQDKKSLAEELSKLKLTINNIQKFF